MRLLQVSLDEAEVGELQEHEGLWRFSYADSWRVMEQNPQARSRCFHRMASWKRVACRL